MELTSNYALNKTVLHFTVESTVTFTPEELLKYYKGYIKTYDEVSRDHQYFPVHCHIAIWEFLRTKGTVSDVLLEQLLENTASFFRKSKNTLNASMVENVIKKIQTINNDNLNLINIIKE